MNLTSQSQNESGANSARAGNVQSAQICSQCHPTDEELLHAMLECPLLLDYLFKTPHERLRIEGLLSQWQSDGRPDLKSLREQALLGALPESSKIVNSVRVHSFQNGRGGVRGGLGTRHTALGTSPLSHSTVLGVCEVLSNSSNTKSQSRVSISNQT